MSNTPKEKNMKALESKRPLSVRGSQQSPLREVNFKVRNEAIDKNKQDTLNKVKAPVFNTRKKSHDGAQTKKLKEEIIDNIQQSPQKIKRHRNSVDLQKTPAQKPRKL